MTISITQTDFRKICLAFGAFFLSLIFSFSAAAQRCPTDTIAPVAQCKNAVVYLDSFGNAPLSIFQIDSFSRDNCGIDSFFLNRKLFLCRDIDSNNVVILTVRDSAKNVATCTAQVLVRDTFAPSVKCPKNIVKTLESGQCFTIIDFSATVNDNCGAKLRQISGSKSGSLFYRGVNFIAFEAVDSSKNKSVCSFNITVEGFPATGSLACPSQIEIALDSACFTEIKPKDLLLGQNYRCFDDYSVTTYQGGFPTYRNFVTAEQLGRTIVARVIDNRTGNYCSTNIYVVDHKAPTIESPADAVVGCLQIPFGGTPSSVVSGEPIILFECSGRTSSYYSDQIFEKNCPDVFSQPPTGFPTDVFFDKNKATDCFKIIVRTFTVSDTYNNLSRCKQVIYVKNITFQDVQCPSDKWITCVGSMSLNTQPDNITVNNQVVEGTGRPVFRNTGAALEGGSCRITTTFKDIRFDNIDNRYTIFRQWIVSNNCSGKTDTCTQKIIVFDEPPTITCQANFTVDITVAKTAEVKFTDLISSVFDACTPYERLQFGLQKAGQGSGFPLDKMLILSCLDTGFQNINVFVKDESNKIATCKTRVHVTDLNEFCDPLSIGGKIRTEGGFLVVSNVLLVDSLGQKTTQKTADFRFGNVYRRRTYRIAAERPLDWRAGVTVFDIAAISKYLLDVQPLDNAYRVIAADVNFDGEVDGSDILFIRNLILRKIDSIPNGRPWRFIPKNFVFPNPNDPFSTPLPEFLTYKNVLDSVQNADFIAIKTGDVNLTARPNFTGGLQERSTNKPLIFKVKDVFLKKNEETEIVFENQSSNVLGYQFTANADVNLLKIESIESLNPTYFTENNAAYFKEKNAATVVWNGSENAPKSLFKLKIKAVEDANLSSILKLNSDLTLAEAYTNSGETMDVKLEFEGKITTNTEGVLSPNLEFKLFQNQPNPFNEETKIGFNLPEAGVANLTIFDELGRTTKIITASFLKGYNEIAFAKNTFLGRNTEGVFFYKLDTATHSTTKRMVVLR